MKTTKTIAKLNTLAHSHGRCHRTRMGSGVVALILAILCFLGRARVPLPAVPQHAGASQVLRRLGDPPDHVLAMVIAGGISLYNILFARTRWLAASAFFLVAAAALLGGAKVPVDNFADHTPYIGLDWFILDLLGSSLIFVFIEKLFALRREQPVFRAEWQVDMQHFIVTT